MQTRHFKTCLGVERKEKGSYGREQPRRHGFYQPTKPQGKLLAANKFCYEIYSRWCLQHQEEMTYHRLLMEFVVKYTVWSLFKFKHGTPLELILTGRIKHGSRHKDIKGHTHTQTKYSFSKLSLSLHFLNVPILFPCVNTLIKLKNLPLNRHGSVLETKPARRVRSL